MSEIIVGTDGKEGWWLTGIEIVRCRDCKYRVLDPEPIDPGWPWMCDETGRDMLEPQGFCAWAERTES